MIIIDHLLFYTQIQVIPYTIPSLDHKMYMAKVA